MKLSEEQQEFINLALSEENILVDACIGSGKTTSIQALCDKIPDKKILYLTYNKLLKDDARKKIKNQNVDVHNYHSFALLALNVNHIATSVTDSLLNFHKHKPKIKNYDVIMIDEYQDIDMEIAYMLNDIKMQCPDAQILAVGDMCQKIYDKTNLNVLGFIHDFLDEYKTVQFTTCFRIGKDHAEYLGRIWNKEIKGVNKKCTVEDMGYETAYDFISKQKPGDILCLGKRNSYMSGFLNKLEEEFPETFNKRTVYASIRDDNITPDNHTAIFTTYDASKGLERPICMIFDYDESYWQTRSHNAGVKYEILRNIFLVAASRGKQRIIFVKYPKGGRKKITEDMLVRKFNENKRFNNFFVSTMFDFKYKEDIEECYSWLNIKKKRRPKEIIHAKSRDSLIDLSPCIDIFQQADFFWNYDLLEQIKYDKQQKNEEGVQRMYPILDTNATKQQMVLYDAMVQTNYDRYLYQVETPFMEQDTIEAIRNRLSEFFTGKEPIQLDKKMFLKDDLGDSYEIAGRCDVVKDDIIYELKFVDEVSHEHFLQAAFYSLLFKTKKACLFNVHTNEFYEITIENPIAFKKCVLKCITKGNAVFYGIDKRRKPEKVQTKRKKKV